MSGGEAASSVPVCAAVDLARRLAKRSGVSPAEAADQLDRVVNGILTHLRKGQKALLPGLVLVAGRYEGLDQRVVDSRIDRELSIGDYVLSGGEFAALVVIDALSRYLPGVLGNARSAQEDSFASGLLDWPHYTRPPVWEGREVPAVLQGGDHAAIKRWRWRKALRRTRERRPDLMERGAFTEEVRRMLEEDENG